MKLTKSWSAFNYHYALVVLNNVSDKWLLPIMPTTATSGKYFWLILVFGEGWSRLAFAERAPSLWSIDTWQKKKWYKVLEFKPDSDWSFFLGRQNYAFLGQEKSQWALWVLMTKGSKTVLGVARMSIISRWRKVWLCLGSWVNCKELPARPLLAAWPGDLEAVPLTWGPSPAHVSVPVQNTETATTHQSLMLPEECPWSILAWCTGGRIGIMLSATERHCGTEKEGSQTLPHSFVPLWMLAPFGSLPPYLQNGYNRKT